MLHLKEQTGSSERRFPLSTRNGNKTRITVDSRSSALAFQLGIHYQRCTNRHLSVAVIQRFQLRCSLSVVIHRKGAFPITKHLTAIGNSLGLIIEKPILDLLNITRETPLEVTTDGVGLYIRPVGENHPPRPSDRTVPSQTPNDPRSDPSE